MTAAGAHASYTGDPGRESEAWEDHPPGGTTTSGASQAGNGSVLPSAGRDGEKLERRMSSSGRRHTVDDDDEFSKVFPSDFSAFEKSCLGWVGFSYCDEESLATMLDEDTKTALARELNFAIGIDITNLANAVDAENELMMRRNYLQSCLNVSTKEVPSKLSSAVKKAERSSQKVDSLKQKSEAFKSKVEHFLKKTEPVRNELTQRFADIKRLEEIKAYLESLEKVEDLNRQLKVCSDDEQAVLLYGQLQELCAMYTEGHRAAYVIDNTRHWHTVLKDRLSKLLERWVGWIGERHLELIKPHLPRQYEEVLKGMKWPLSTGQEPYTPPREVLTKFNNLTKYLLLIQDPSTATKSINDTDCEPSLPVKILLRPLKKRFAFHFTSSRQTARIDRPEWFLTQTLTWIKDHKSFLNTNVQPIADKLEVKGVKAEEEFNVGLVSLAAERLHTVLALYSTQGNSMDVDAAFAHAIDEALGFHRELTTVTGQEINTVLSVLTKAETFVRWLEVEKKFALSKMDETLSTEQWMEPMAAGVESAMGDILWVPRGADWFITLLKTIEDRYTMLPQPGHRLQFLELQLELVEEWRVRLTQLMSASYTTLAANSFLTPDASPHPLTAAINAAHHTRTALIQWAHSLHYLQLHYYRRQFQHFTEMQHSDDAPFPPLRPPTPEPGVLQPTRKEYLLIEGDKQHKPKPVANDMDDNLSLIEVEVRANKLALNDVTRRDSSFIADLSNIIPQSPLAGAVEGAPMEMTIDGEDSAVFGDLPALLAHLRYSGLGTLSDHMLLEFKAGLRDYKKQKWHAMPVIEEMALSVSTSLCRPLAELCARLHSTRAKLAPSLSAKLRTHVAAELDIYLFEEVVLENWWNSGGTIQFTHDVKRNLMPVFAPPGVPATRNLPRLWEACKILNMDYDESQRLRDAIIKDTPPCDPLMLELSIRHIMPIDVLQILNQRTDLNDTRAMHQAVMEYF